MLLKKIKEMPIIVKITLWYSFFISIFIIFLFFSSLIISNKINTERYQKKLINYVLEISSDIEEFEAINDDVFFIMYSKNSLPIDGYSPKGFDSNLKLEHDTLNKSENFYYYDFEIKGEETYWIRGIMPINEINSENQKLFLILIIIFPVLLMIISFGGYIIMKNAFKPVKIISDTALEIKNSKNFSNRIKLENGKDEIHQIAYSFNEMLDTLETSYIHAKQFSSDVSHELRTPISVILAESSYSLEYADNFEEMKESMEVINRQASRMSNLINQIMELTKLEQINNINLEKINFSNLLEKYISDYISILDNKNIEIEVNIDKNIHILADKTMLERVIDNILSNALKFTKDKIVIELFEKENENIFIIKDNGLGISKEDQKLIWERFFQSNESRNKESNKGSGLGLSLVKKILNLHNAKIYLESEINKGSKFIIHFPKK